MFDNAISPPALCGRGRWRASSRRLKPLDSPSAPAQRGFNDAVSLHLSRKY